MLHREYQWLNLSIYDNTASSQWIYQAAVQETSAVLAGETTKQERAHYTALALRNIQLLCARCIIQ